MPIGPEAGYEPGSHNRVLRNKLGIKTKLATDEAEFSALVHAQTVYVRDDIVTSDTVFTAGLIRQMHRDWLGGIYEWAGAYRTVDVSKGGFTFPPAYLIPDNMNTFESELLSRLTPCEPNDVSVVCSSVAQVHAELLLIHPFREGNGRLARWIA